MESLGFPDVIVLHDLVHTFLVLEGTLVLVSKKSDRAIFGSRITGETIKEVVFSRINMLSEEKSS